MEKKFHRIQKVAGENALIGDMQADRMSTDDIRNFLCKHPYPAPLKDCYGIMIMWLIVQQDGVPVVALNVCSKTASLWMIEAFIRPDVANLERHK